jgi:hypothetical protein
MWQRGCDVFMANADFFSEFEGGMDAPVAVKNDFKAGAGATLIFTTKSTLGSEPKRANATFDQATDFETFDVGTDRLTVDWFRHAVRWNERTEHQLGMVGELYNDVPEMLGDWLGRVKCEQMAMMFRELGNPENYMLPLGISSVDGITADYTLDYTLAMHATSRLKLMNGTPAAIGTLGRNKIKKYVIVPLTESLLSLETDPDYLRQMESADVRGDANFIFAGGFHNLRSHAVKEWNVVEHDGNYALGCPFFPKNLLGEAITQANTAQAIYAGEDTSGGQRANTKYFKWFPGYNYEWISGDTLSDHKTVADDFPFYLVIHNNGTESTNGAGDAYKWGFYRISANNGITLTMDKRLRAAASGIAVTQLGYVTWNSSVNTDRHPVNSLMFLANARGLPLFNTLILGAHAARRGYGKYKNKRGDESHEDDFIQEVFVKSVFGQGLRKDRKDRYPGFMMLTHTGTVPGYDTTNAVLADTIA